MATPPLSGISLTTPHNLTHTRHFLPELKGIIGDKIIDNIVVIVLGRDSSLDLRAFILEKALIIPAILIGFTVHEFAHAKVASLLGDETPRYQGRLTLNPIAHIDWIGFFALLLVGFGWAKPVQVNPRSFKNVRADYLKVTIAGPVSNLVTGFAFALLTGFLSTFVRYAPNGGDLLYTLLFIIIRINCILCVFNLLPIPPLDGYQVLKTLVPAQYGRYLYYLERYQLILLFIIILIPGASSIITVPAQGLYYLMTNWITLLR
jgi:Zn-dependent protease